jgi:UDP-N-acetylmuramoylalanine--D-glutamate ligase
VRTLSLRGKRVLVIGLGMSGRSAVRFCSERGAEVTGCDQREDCDTRDLPAEPNFVLGQLPDPANFDLVVPSPGVPRDQYASAPLALGDIELTYLATDMPLVAVTGTNGKSTTVTLLAALLSGLRLRVRAAGNLGVPALSLVDQALDIGILEVSSFQLESVSAFRPRVALLLNLSEDHLDRHGSFANYAEAKAAIFKQQGSGDTAITDGGDPLCDRLARSGGARQLRFQTAPHEAKEWDATLANGSACVRTTAGLEQIDLPEILRKGLPEANLLGALLAVEALGYSAREAVAAAGTFEPLPHRLQEVARISGVRFVDDSKATNPGAAETALQTVPGPLVWLAGGRDKGLAFDSLAEVASRKARSAVLYGEAAPKLAKALSGRLPYLEVRDFDDAVRRAHSESVPGDAVLLAPACASFDQFRSFEARGKRFREIAEDLENKP